MKTKYSLLILLFCFSYIKSFTQDEAKYRIEKLSESCNKGSNSACNKIKEIAINEKSQVIRQLAIEKIEDQIFLKNIVLNDKDDYIRVQATKRISDQNFLKEISLHDKEPFVRIAALDNITDTVFVYDLLKRMALKEIEFDDWLYPESYRVACIEKLNDQFIFEKIAKDVNCYIKVRIAAIKKLEDQTILKDIAFNEMNVETQNAAIKELTDTNLITTGFNYFKNNPALKTKLETWENEAPEEVKKKIERIRKGGPEDRAYASDEIGIIGKEAKGAILALIENLGNNTRLMIIGNFGGYSTVANYSSGALSKIGKFSIESLCYILTNNSFIVRRQAAKALNWMENSDYYNLDTSLVKMLINSYKNNNDIEIKENLALVMANLKNYEAIALLIEDLQHSNSSIKSRVIYALGTTNDKNAVQPLIASLECNEYIIRKPAIEALGNLKDYKAIDPLIEIICNSNDTYIVSAANDALQKITGQRLYGEQDWKDWREKQKKNN